MLEALLERLEQGLFTAQAAVVTRDRTILELGVAAVETERGRFFRAKLDEEGEILLSRLRDRVVVSTVAPRSYLCRWRRGRCRHPRRRRASRRAASDAEGNGHKRRDREYAHKTSRSLN